MNILKIFLITILLPVHAFGLVPENFLQDDHFTIEYLVLMKKGAPNSRSHKVVDNFPQVSADPNNRIIPDFDVPKYFESKVRFWFNIYTAYDSRFVVLHDKRNLGIIYDVLDFRNFKKRDVNSYLQSYLQVRSTLDRVREIKKSLLKLSKDSLSGKQKKLIVSALRAANLKIPQESSKRQDFFQGLASNMRAQTGQRGNIYQGIRNFYPLKDTLLEIFDVMRMPQGLLAIAFLESSFTPYARSRAGAYGTWQFMRRTGKYFMKVEKNVDHRANPIISTIGALHLLKQNKQIMKRWDMAVTAFNSGTKHLLRARRQLKKVGRNVNLQNIFTHYKHPHLGFASQNYYSEFLALVYTLAYKEKFYPEIYSEKQKNAKRKNKLKVYVTKCKVSPSKIFAIVKRSAPNMSDHNTHFLNRQLTYPKGSVIVSSIKLKRSKYKLIAPIKYRKLYPKNFWKLVRNQSCSTK